MTAAMYPQPSIRGGVPQQKQMGGVPPQMMGTLQGPTNVPPQYSTGTYAPQPSQQAPAPSPAPSPSPGYQPPATAGQAPPSGYSGVPVVVTGVPSGAAGGTNNAMNALYAMGTGPVDTSALNATNAALQQQMQYDMANAAAYGASAAFGQGGAGTPVQILASQQAANAMIPINSQMQQANLSFYNQQSANQLAALQSSGQLGLGQQGQDLNAQVAQQNALFGANTQNLATQNQAFNQQLASQQQAANMYNSMYGMGSSAQAAEQANLDAMYQMYMSMDPTGQLAAMMGATPMYAQQQTPFNPFSAVQAGMTGYGMAGGFNPSAPLVPNAPTGAGYMPMIPGTSVQSPGLGVNYGG